MYYLAGAMAIRELPLTRLAERAPLVDLSHKGRGILRSSSVVIRATSPIAGEG